MTEKELKKLNRKQLLELLLAQTRQVEQLQAQLEEAKRHINNKILAETEAGSIAEASLKLNNVFESADAAVAQYVENIKKLSENQAMLNARTEAESRQKAEAMIADAEKRCREREHAAEQKLKEISDQLQRIYEQKQVLDDLFKGFTVK